MEIEGGIAPLTIGVASRPKSFLSLGSSIYMMGLSPIGDIDTTASMVRPSRVLNGSSGGVEPLLLAYETNEGTVPAHTANFLSLVEAVGFEPTSHCLKDSSISVILHFHKW
jgi:hypothetical protein